MTLKEYSEAIKPFAIYPGHTLGDLGYLHPGLQYVILGLLEETGEVAGVVKKCMRDSDSQYTATVRDKMTKELGDVLWYYTQLLYHLGIDEIDSHEVRAITKQNPQMVNETMQCAVVHLCICCRDIWLAITDDQYSQADRARQGVSTSHFLRAWAHVVQVFGLSVDEIMQVNIAKLQSRMDRGVISGSGDDR